MLLKPQTQTQNTLSFLFNKKKQEGQYKNANLSDKKMKSFCAAIDVAWLKHGGRGGRRGNMLTIM